MANTYILKKAVGSKITDKRINVEDNKLQISRSEVSCMHNFCITKRVAREKIILIIPAYHMNKEHWNTIIISKDVNETLVYELIDQSYELTKK